MHRTTALKYQYKKKEMKVFKIALALAIVAISSLAAQAKVEPTTAYMFGFASSFNDSTVYITSVQKVDSVYLSHKNLFLEGRDNYSFQLRDYLESIGEPKRTCIVVFDRNFKKAEKKWAKLYERYTKKPKAKRLKSGEKPKELPSPWQVKSVDENKFTFKPIAPDDIQEPMTKQERKEAKLKAREEAKQQKVEAKLQKAEAKKKKAEAKAQAKKAQAK